MDNHGSPHFTPSGDSFGYIGSNSEGYISYPNSYDMITSGSPAFNPLGLSNNMPSYPMTRVASPREFTGTQTVSPPLTGSSSDVSGENLATGYTAYGSMRRPARQNTSDSNASSNSTHSRSGSGLVQRHGLRFPPGPAASTVMAAGGRHRRRNSRADDDDDDDDFESDGDAFRGGNGNAPQEVVVQRRREEIRKQRIESEQRRRDELRDGYRRLKDVLPVSNQKSSKVSLLDRATSHIKYLEMMQHQLQTNLTQSDIEVARLRQVNEALMLSAAERRSGAQSAPAQSAPAPAPSHNGSPKTEPTPAPNFN